MNLINSGDVAWLLISSAMVLLMTPGLAFFYGGFVKRKNILNTLMASIFIMGLASVLWVLFGYSLSFSGNIGGFIGNLHWFGLTGVGDAPNPDYATTIPHMLFAIFQMMFAIITPALITGSVAERMKFSSLIIFTTIWSFLVYYPLAHMVWGAGGFLRELGAVDFAGGTVVHISSGVSGLVAALMLGKRKNHGKATYHPHNVPLIVLGAAMLWFGWFGFNAGSAGAANGLAVHAFITTNTSGAAAMLSWVLIEKIRSGKPTLVGAVTGGVIGLASITQGAGFVPVWAAIIVGAVVSPLCYFGITVLKSRFGYDDALDAFGCHGIGGIWGGLATGLFALTSINSAARWNGLVFGDLQLFLRQLAAIGITIVISVIGTVIAFSATKLFGDMRVSARDEDVGLDTSEHGEHAYPAFNGMD